jgi:hypothetical protein
MPHDDNYYKLRCKNLEKENGILRKKVLNYADKFDFVGSKSIMAECTKWKGKYDKLLKTTIGKDKTHYKKRFLDMECECAYYKSKFFDYEYKLKKEIQLSLELKDRSDKLFSEKEDLATSITNLIKQKIKLEQKLELVENVDSYGYNSMEACIEDMNSDNPEYPFTEKEKEKILKDNKKLEEKECQVQFMEENNEKLEEKPIENKEDEYQYSGTSHYAKEDFEELNIPNVLTNKKIKKRIMGNIRKKHKDLYKKHKVIVQLVDIEQINKTDQHHYVLKFFKYTYELVLKDKPKKKQNINI